MFSRSMQLASCTILLLVAMSSQLPTASCCLTKIKNAIKSKFNKAFGEKAPAVYLRGCYIDSQDLRDLPTFAGYSDTMESGYCALKCKKWETKYLGLQEGNSCWCGNTFGAHGEAKEACTTRCLGNDDEMCGGTLHNSVYELAAS